MIVDHAGKHSFRHDLVALLWFLRCTIAGGDKLYFHIGRHGGGKLITRFPSWKERVGKVKARIDRYHTLAILLFRFFYGLRTVSPFAIGMSSVSGVKFFFLNMLSAALWAAAVGFAGYFFGQGMELIFKDIKHYELELIILLACTGILVLILSHIRKKRKASQKEKH